MRWLNAITDSMDMNLDKLRKMVRDREAQHVAARLQRVKHDLETEDKIYHLFQSIISLCFRSCIFLPKSSFLHANLLLPA